MEGDAAQACALFARAAEVGDRFDEPDLPALSRLGWGHALLMLGDSAAGVAMFDEVMVARWRCSAWPRPARQTGRSPPTWC